MEVCAPDIQGGHLRFADPDTGRAVIRVPVAIDLQPRSGPGGADQADDGREVVQVFAAPVLADERIQPVLYTVPFAGPWRQVAHADLYAEFACELLQFDLPQPGPVPVGATAVDGDMQLQVAGLARLPQALPPVSDAIDHFQTASESNFDSKGHPSMGKRFACFATSLQCTDWCLPCRSAMQRDYNGHSRLRPLYVENENLSGDTVALVGRSSSSLGAFLCDTTVHKDDPDQTILQPTQYRARSKDL